MYSLLRHSLLTVAFATFLSHAFGQKQTVVRPGEVWPDEDGNHIQAHGGGIIKIGKNIIGMANNAARGWTPTIAM